MLEPIGFVAMVEVEEVQEFSKGGIAIITDKVMERNAQTIGKVLAFGEDFAVAYKPKTPRWGLKVGDKVIYAKNAGKWVKDPETDKEYLFVLDQDIVGKVLDGNSNPVVAS
jgi:co-chaperonin GroES (HSP10)